MNRFVNVIRTRQERSRRAPLLLPIHWARSNPGSYRRGIQTQCTPITYRWLHTLLLALLVLSLLLPQPLWSQTSSPNATPTTVDNSVPPTATPNAEQLSQQAITAHINRVFDAMSPADRVGQLFVITFDGNQIAQNSDIVKLIYQERIGGVVLTPTKHNFTNTKGENTPVAVAQLINQLQALTYGYLVRPEEALTLPLTSSLPFSGTLPLAAATPSPAVPLLVGVEQQGDGYPATALRRGFTTLPSQMALGATWDPALVQAVGTIVGQELHAVGVNLLLGPNLDVVDEPRTDPVGALGLYSFGGDPYWVSQLGRAYITGVHEGSGNGVATIARHFPGQGDIDRFPDKEVATVQKNLLDLRTISLPPFMQVTRQVSPILSGMGDLAATDGLMTSHMRYSAWQGVTSGRTTPMSLNPDLKMLLSDEGLGDWYNAGGIMMTNGLGLPAIRRYYEATLHEFAYKRVALDAFVAGHDLLYLTHLSNDGAWATEKQYFQEILQFFRERYKKEADFRVQVDRAVHRILRLKFGLYQDRPPLQTSGEERITANGVPMLVPALQVLRQRADLALFAEASPHRTAAADILSQVTRAAITLLYPDVENLSDVIATPPQANDQLLIFSDSRLFSECVGCIAETALGPEELKSIITHLYGSEPGGTGQIDPARVYGRSFVELGALLDAAEAGANVDVTATTVATTVVATRPLTDLQTLSTPVNDALADDGDMSTEELLTANERLQRLINESNWIIFAMLDVDPTNKSGSDVVKRFLRQQSEQLGNKQVIVLALNAPYFLDATEISKLTAYFGVYSKTQPFLESAIRAIFRSATAPGAPPVSVPGTRFNDLSLLLQPDPNNPLHLRIYVGENELTLPTTTEGPDPVVNVGDTLRIEVSRILDYNGHPVPDGVKVELQLIYEGRDMTIPLEPAVVRNGSATQTVTVEQPGRLLLSARAGEAKTTVAVSIRIQDPVASNNATAAITTTAAAANQPAGDVTETLSVTETSMATLPDADNPADQPGVSVTTLVIAFLTILVTLSLLLILQIRILPRAMLVQNMLWATIFGLSAYILYGLHILPGMVFLQESLRVWGAAVVVFISMLLPLLWLQLRAE